MTQKLEPTLTIEAAGPVRSPRPMNPDSLTWPELNPNIVFVEDEYRPRTGQANHANRVTSYLDPPSRALPMANQAAALMEDT